MIYDFENINYKQSILKKRLEYKNNWQIALNKILIVLSFGFFFYLFLYSNYVKTVSFVTVTLALICAFVVYRKLTENKLFVLHTDLSKEETRKLVDNYFRKQKYNKQYNKQQIAIYVHETSFFLGTYYYIVIPLENHILYTVIKEQERLPLPAIFSLWTMRADLKQLFREHLQ